MPSSEITAVTIEGSLTPSVHLARGERKTVQLTPFIQKLIDRGFVNVLGEYHDEPALDEPPAKPARRAKAAPPSEAPDPTLRLQAVTANDEA